MDPLPDGPRLHPTRPRKSLLHPGERHAGGPRHRPPPGVINARRMVAST